MYYMYAHSPFLLSGLSTLIAAGCQPISFMGVLFGFAVPVKYSYDDISHRAAVYRRAELLSKKAEEKFGSAIAALGGPRYGDLLDLQAQTEQFREPLSGFKHELQACEPGMRVEGGQSSRSDD